MSETQIAVIVFACVFGGAVFGIFLRFLIPEHHLSEDTKDVIELGMGLIATMTALVLGLMIATAKNSYDALDQAVKHTAAKVLLLDHMLSAYGPETRDTRELLRGTLASRLEAIWPENRSQPARANAAEAVFMDYGIESRILQLSTHNGAQRWLHTQALRISRDIMETRLLVVGSRGSSIPLPFLVVVVFWLTIIFGSFGLFAPRNTTVVAVLFLCSLSVAGSIFLILEMDLPFEGVMQVSSAPLRYALSHLMQ